MKKIIVGVAFVLGMGISQQTAQANCSDETTKEAIATEFNKLEFKYLNCEAPYETRADLVKFHSKQKYRHDENGDLGEKINFSLEANKKFITKDECNYNDLHKGTIIILDDCKKTVQFTLN